MPTALSADISAENVFLEAGLGSALLPTAAFGFLCFNLVANTTCSLCSTKQAMLARSRTTHTFSTRQLSCYSAATTFTSPSTVA
jgi:hypothetical protein